ncbi:hypothetical protein FRC10_010454, partial [Ceratobasidium sp. 414]
MPAFHTGSTRSPYTVYPGVGTYENNAVCYTKRLDPSANLSTLPKDEVCREFMHSPPTFSRGSVPSPPALGRVCLLGFSDFDSVYATASAAQLDSGVRASHADAQPLPFPLYDSPLFWTLQLASPCRLYYLESLSGLHSGSSPPRLSPLSDSTLLARSSRNLTRLHVSSLPRSTHYLFLVKSPYLVANPPFEDHERAHVYLGLPPVNKDTCGDVSGGATCLLSPGGGSSSGATPANTSTEMRAKPIYLLRGYCGWSVKKIVEHSRWVPNNAVEWREDDFWVRGDTVGEFINAGIVAWKKQVASGYWGVVKTLNCREVYDLIKDRVLTEDQFFDWLDQRAWDAAQDQLDKDMAALTIADEEKGR